MRLTLLAGLLLLVTECYAARPLQVDVADDAGGTDADWWTTTASLKAAAGGDGGSKVMVESSLLAALQARLDELEKRVSASEQHTIAQQQSEPSHGEQAARKQQPEAGAQAGDSTAAAEVEPQGTQVQQAQPAAVAANKAVEGPQVVGLGAQGQPGAAAAAAALDAGLEAEWAGAEMDEGDEEEVDEEEPETVKGWGPSTTSAGGNEQDGNDADDDQPHYDWESEADSNGEAAQEEQKRKVSWEEGYE
ncbi:hypothetical protein D9Q98_000886 [Chlorella vulgaris]|uniref:Uncharacterized protein n=1 Tax=Chlorella vulgaris TaxID=3077 RepID=A0A9D4Z2E5_CHLVU|nr:hypothetical protein D9Q98_000886 [Chlorella vulgaris]